MQPPIKAYKQAFDNKITNFYKITSSDNQRLDDVEFAIKANHPVVFSTLVSKDFTQAFGDISIWDHPTDENNVAGRHAMIITGVRYLANGSREFYWRNSWGRDWGMGDGHTWVKDSYVAWNMTADLYVPTYMQDLVL
jgi:hypothetical protein